METTKGKAVVYPEPWPKILAVPFDVTKEDVESLQAEGVVVVRSTNPQLVRVIGGTTDVDAGTLAMAALEALNAPNSTSERTVFVNELVRRLKAKEAK